MKLIRNLPTRISKRGRVESWAIFWCDGCNQEVEKGLSDGKKCKSCGCQRFSEEVRQKMSESGKNKIFTEEHRKNIGIKLKGENNPFYGKKHTEKTRQLMMGKNNPMYGIHRFGEESPNWQGGVSFLPYAPEFNKKLKQFILERDNYICQDPNCKHSSNKLDIHHIDFNKQNNNHENFITLCIKCHSKTKRRKNKQDTINYYQNIMMNRIMECLL